MGKRCADLRMLTSQQVSSEMGTAQPPTFENMHRSALGMTFRLDYPHCMIQNAMSPYHCTEERLRWVYRTFPVENNGRSCRHCAVCLSEKVVTFQLPLSGL